MSQPHDVVALRVVNFLGLTAVVALLGVVVLVYHATGYDKIDPSTVPLVAGVSTLAGIALGALGSILSSTGKGTPTPVTVENSPAAPLPVVETPAAPATSSYSVGDPVSDL